MGAYNTARGCKSVAKYGVVRVQKAMAYLIRVKFNFLQNPIVLARWLVTLCRSAVVHPLFNLIQHYAPGRKKCRRGYFCGIFALCLQLSLTFIVQEV